MNEAPTVINVAVHPLIALLMKEQNTMTDNGNIVQKLFDPLSKLYFSIIKKPVVHKWFIFKWTTKKEEKTPLIIRYFINVSGVKIIIQFRYIEHSWDNVCCEEYFSDSDIRNINESQKIKDFLRLISLAGEKFKL